MQFKMVWYENESLCELSHKSFLKTTNLSLNSKGCHGHFKKYLSRHKLFKLMSLNVLDLDLFHMPKYQCPTQQVTVKGEHEKGNRLQEG